MDRKPFLGWGKVLDVRNRWRACARVGVEPKTEKFTGPDALAFVLSHNLKRRHLTESQRAMIAAKVATMRMQDTLKQNAAPSIDGAGLTKKDRVAAAAELHVGTASVDRAKRVQRDGIEELQQAVERGEVSVFAAANVSKLPPEKQKEVVAGGHESRDVPSARQSLQPAGIL